MHLERFMETRHNYIPAMGWEKSFGGAIGLSLDQTRFMLALFASIPAGYAVRGMRSAFGRRTGLACRHTSLHPHACSPSYPHPPCNRPQTFPLSACTPSPPPLLRRHRFPASLLPLWIRSHPRRSAISPRLSRRPAGALGMWHPRLAHLLPLPDLPVSEPEGGGKL